MSEQTATVRTPIKAGASLWHAPANAAEREKAIAGERWVARCGVRAKRAKDRRPKSSLTPMERCAVCCMTT